MSSSGVYWNRDHTEKAVKTIYNFYKQNSNFYQHKLDKAVEDTVAFMMKNMSTEDSSKYDDEYARHNIRNYIYAHSFSHFSDYYYQGIPIWVNQTEIEIEYDPYEPLNRGKRGLLTEVDAQGFYHGTWGDFAIDPHFYMLEIWNQ